MTNLPTLIVFILQILVQNLFLEASATQVLPLWGNAALIQGAKVGWQVNGGIAVASFFLADEFELAAGLLFGEIFGALDGFLVLENV